MILLNPDDNHTGNPADKHGFRWRAVYLSRTQIEKAAYYLGIPLRRRLALGQVRVDDPQFLFLFNRLHDSANFEDCILKKESVAVQFLTLLLNRYANQKSNRYSSSNEYWIIKKAKEYVLADLAKKQGSEVENSSKLFLFRHKKCPRKGLKKTVIYMPLDSIFVAKLSPY